MHGIDSWGDLSWYFGCSIGMAAQSYEGGSSGVHDEYANHMLQMRMRSFQHRRDVNRHTRITARLAVMSGDDQRTLSLAFSPWGSDARACFGLLSATTRRGTCLAGIVVRSGATASAFRDAHDADVDVPQSLVLQWLDSVAKRPNGLNLLRRLADSAEREVLQCVTRYEASTIDVDNEAALRVALGVAT